jgi:hypothetical protein
MKDFETHDIGTAEEIRLSRNLATAMTQMIYQYGEGIIPIALLRPYKELFNHHNKCIEVEKYQNGI